MTSRPSSELGQSDNSSEREPFSGDDDIEFLAAKSCDDVIIFLAKSGDDDEIAFLTSWLFFGDDLTSSLTGESVDEVSEFLTKRLFSVNDVSDFPEGKSGDGDIWFSLELVVVADGFMKLRKSLLFRDGVEVWLFLDWDEVWLFLDWDEACPFLEGVFEVSFPLLKDDDGELRKEQFSSFKISLISFLLCASSSDFLWKKWRKKVLLLNNYKYYLWGFFSEKPEKNCITIKIKCQFI